MFVLTLYSLCTPGQNVTALGHVDQTARPSTTVPELRVECDQELGAKTWRGRGRLGSSGNPNIWSRRQRRNETLVLTVVLH